MPLAKGHGPKTVSKNISEFHKGPTYARTLSKFGKKKADKQAVAVALSTARKYADGGEVEESQDRLMKTAEGFPFVQAGEAIQPPGSGLYNLGKSVMQGMRDRATAPAPIKSQELPPPYEEPRPDVAIAETAKAGAKHIAQDYADYFDPHAKDEAGKYVAEQPIPQTPSGKVPQTEKSFLPPLAGALDIASNFAGLGISKAAIAFGAKMAAQQAGKQATKTLNPMKAALLAEHPGFLDTSSFKQAGHQLGFHAGGVYTNPSDGVQYYLKTGPSIDQVQNEQLGAKLYALAGTPVAEVSITHLQGQPGIASKMLPNAHQLSETKLPYEQIPGLHDNFVVDAWLANHDAVGTGGENPLGNIMISNGKAIRIDSGGTLRFKGSGDPKKHFFDEADEVDSMRSYDFSKRSADVFHNVSPEALKIGAQKVADVEPAKLAMEVARYGPSDTNEAQALVTKLLKRREYIMNKFGVKPSWEKPQQISNAQAEAALAAIEKELGLAPEAARPTTKLTPEDWEKKIAEEQMIGEKDFSQGPLPSESLVPVDETSRAVKAIQPEKKPLPLYAEMKLNSEQWEKLSATEELDKKSAKSIAAAIHSGPDSPYKAFETAAHLWQMATEHPSKAEAVFRALPDEAQKIVGRRLAALKDTLIASPFDNMKYKSSKYLISHTTGHDVPAHLWSDKEFVKGFEKAKEIIGSKPKDEPVEIKKFQTLADKQKAAKAAKAEIPKAKPVFQTPEADAKKIAAEANGNGYEAAKKLYQLALYNSGHADEVYKKLPHDLQPDVNDELSQLIAARGDPWTMTFTKKSNLTSIMSDMEPVDWNTYKPVFAKNITKPKFGFITEAFAQKLGFRTDLLLYRGGSWSKEATDWSYSNPLKSYKDIPDDLKYKKELHDPSTYKDYTTERERAYFLTDEKNIAQEYGENVVAYVARPKKVAKIDWTETVGDGMPTYHNQAMRQLIDAAKMKGLDMLIIENLGDVPMNRIQSQYLIFNPEILRGPNAKFDPKKLHLRIPLAGVAGGGLLAYGSLKGEGEKMKRGGSINTALRLAKEYASGGPGSAPWNVSRSSHIPHGPGMIQSAVPGRTDKLPLSIKSGSFILPADIPSALGEGNTMAGGKILSKMMDSGPMGTPKLTAPRVKKTKFPALVRFRKQKFADGGESEEVPIIAAGGEYIVGPEQVAGVGGGDLDEGHKVLKNFVLDVRRKNIKTLRKLKEPKMG